MPWEKTFDLDDATDDAIRVFWEKGYEGTSMADLIAGMKINKGSLYNAFGSKQALFHRALLRYDQTNRATRLAELSAYDDPVAAIMEMFDGVVEAARRDPHNLGCFVINTAQDLPNQSPEIAEIVRASLADIEAFFEKLLIRGKSTGQIAADLDEKKVAQSLLSMFVGLRLLSRGGTDISVLEGIREGVRTLLAS